MIPSLVPWNVPKSLNEFLLVSYAFSTTQEKPFTISISVQPFAEGVKVLLSWFSHRAKLHLLDERCIYLPRSERPFSLLRCLSCDGLAYYVCKAVHKFSRMSATATCHVGSYLARLLSSSTRYSHLRLLPSLPSSWHNPAAVPLLVAVFQFHCFQLMLESWKLSLIITDFWH